MRSRGVSFFFWYMPHMKSRITTGQGDDGRGVALSGERLSKTHPIMECVGALDELRAQIALVRLCIVETKPADYETLSRFLGWLLHTLFLIGTACSDPLRKHPELRTRDLAHRHLNRLEAEQLRLERRVSLPQAFVVSASNRTAAQADVACTVARRAERSVVRLKETYPDFPSDIVLPFMNRLSDYLYILARDLDAGHHWVIDYNLLDEA